MFDHTTSVSSLTCLLLLYLIFILLLVVMICQLLRILLGVLFWLSLCREAEFIPSIADIKISTVTIHRPTHEHTARYRSSIICYIISKHRQKDADRWTDRDTVTQKDRGTRRLREIGRQPHKSLYRKTRDMLLKILLLFRRVLCFRCPVYCLPSNVV